MREFFFCPLKIQKKVSKRLGISCVRNGYGMTELTIVTHLTPKGCNKFGTIGQVLPGLSTKVIDPENLELLEPYKVGELCVKGAQVMLGYRNDHQATQDTIDREGWLHTGDLGYYDEDGHMYIVDRLKELIKYKGYQVFNFLSFLAMIMRGQRMVREQSKNGQSIL